MEVQEQKTKIQGHLQIVLLTDKKYKDTHVEEKGEQLGTRTSPRGNSSQWQHRNDLHFLGYTPTEGQATAEWASKYHRRD